ncbi:MAG TPA: OmpA family protein [Bryobacteraceae bacterium]|nr:OmpA family protein [Bryobacteraceae bacterium]
MYTPRAAATAVIGAAAILSLASAGCATKKYVRNQVTPVQNQANDLQKKTADNTTAIGDLDRNVAKTDERAMEADRKATAAAESAAKANDAATQAAQRADAANTLAQQGVNKAGDVEKNLTKTIDNLDNYHLVTTEKVYFRFNHADLNKDDQQKLDTLADTLAKMKNYVVEVEGFTDRSGQLNYNFELSRRRAESVVRYLAANHGIPLRTIHEVGFGPQTKEMTTVDNRGSEQPAKMTRKEERRVDVRVYALDLMASGPTPSHTPSAQ